MSTYFEYSHLEPDIHCFRWLSQSEASILEFYNFIIQLYDNLSEDQQIIRILHDYRSMSFLPPPTIFSKTKSLQSMYPNLERKIAYLSNDDITETLIETLTQTTSRSGMRRFFKHDEEQLAIDWLLADTN